MRSFRAFISTLFLAHHALGHGGLVEPPSRAVMHDYGFPDNPVDNNWMEGFCGGKAHQWSEEIGGKCGICGDAWDAAVRQHEAPGGRYANGVIVRRYSPGELITVTSHITANHVGFVEFRLCPNNNVDQDPDQDCFDRDEAVLVIEETGDTKFWITDAMGTGQFSTRVRLPLWECDQCVLQWTYRNGRDWGTCNGACGAVETFRACADIAISGDVPITTTTTETSNNNTTTESVKTTTTVNNEPTTTTEENVSPGDKCHATGAWEGNSEVDDWCQENCHYDPAYCPPDVCSCDDDSAAAPMTTGLTCVSTGLWSGSSVMTSWCQTNCNNTPSFCPAEMCQCS